MTEELEQMPSPACLAHDDNVLADVKHDLKMFFKFGATSLFDASFLVIWYWFQFYADRFIDGTNLDWLDLTQLWVFKILFAITTLVPVLAYVVLDSTRIILQTRSRIRSAIRDAQND